MSKTLAIFAIVFAISMITMTSAVYAQDQIVNPTPKPVNSTGYIFGCKDGIVMFQVNKGLGMGCINAPFTWKPFNSTESKNYNPPQNTTNPAHDVIVKLCSGKKPQLNKDICKLLSGI